MRPKVKIRCMAYTAEAEMAAQAGADWIGLVGPMPTGPGALSLDDCRRIAEACPDEVRAVLLTSSETAEDIAADARAVGVPAVQVVRHVPPDVHRALDTLVPDVERIQVIHVEGPEAIELIPTYQDHVAAFLLDSGRLSTDELGGTGRVHDWSISRAFVQASPRPVYLAGGLTPQNAAQAVAVVGPHGLDVCSGLRTDGALDPEKLAAFMAALPSRGRAA